MAVSHLVELGHTRIAHLGGPQEVSTGLARYEGFVAAMDQAGLDRRPRARALRRLVHRARGRAGCARELLDAGADGDRAPATT